MQRHSAPIVKICGIQNTDVIQAIAQLPVTHVGFMFAKSKRQVTAQQAGELIAYLRQQTGSRTPSLLAPQTFAPQPALLAVGVFVNPSEEELAAVMEAAPLDVIQLHGQESPDFCRQVRMRFGVQVIKVVSVQKSADASPTLQEVADQLDHYRYAIDGLLLDTYDPVYGGGSGRTFAWECIPVYQEWARQAGVPLLVAGGLHVDNVAKLMAEFTPDGVDVSSGVETDGVKNIDKIAAFVERVTRSVSST